MLFYCARQVQSCSYFATTLRYMFHGERFLQIYFVIHFTMVADVEVTF